MEKPGRGRVHVTLLILFVWVLSLLMCRSIYLKTAEITKSSRQSRVSLRLKSDVSPENSFQSEEIQELRKVFGQEEMSICAFNRLTVSAEPNMRAAQVCGVGEDYYSLNNIRLIKGAFLDEKDFANKNNFAVIEDRLAKDLFNSTDVVGVKISILKNTFRVIGVTANDDSIAGMLTETALPRVYVPLNAIEGKGADFYITNLEIASSEALMHKAMFKEKIAVLGKNPEDFIVFDSNEIVALAKQRYDFILFVIGIYCIYLIALYVVNKLRTMASDIRKEIRKEYLWNVIRKNKGMVFSDLAKLGAAFTAISLLWKEVSFKPYIQSEKLPNDPTSLTQVIQVIKANLRGFLTWDYVYMPTEQKVLNLLDKFDVIIFVLCMVCTLLLLTMSKYEKWQHEEEMVRTSGILCLWLSIFIILSSAVILSIGMPVALSMKEIMLPISSLFIIWMLQGRVSRHINDNKYGNLSQLQGRA